MGLDGACVFMHGFKPGGEEKTGSVKEGDGEDVVRRGGDVS